MAQTLRERIVERRDSNRHSQLASYCQYLPEYEDLYQPPQRIRAWGRTIYLRGTDSYNEALKETPEKLEDLWLADDWEIWGKVDSEVRESWDYSEGYQAALEEVLAMIDEGVD